MRRKLPWFELALGIVFLSAYIYAACSNAYNLPNRWFIRDDAYYYFKVAQNISEGHGSTFDGIHATNGYHPLWLLICIPIFSLARYDLILPLRVLVVVSGVLQLGTALLLYRLVRKVFSEPIAMITSAYWVFNSYILLFLYRTGVEAIIALFFIMLLLVLALRFEESWRTARPSAAQLSLLAAVASLVVFSRLDLIFFVLTVGLWIVLRQSPIRYLLPLDLLAVVVSVMSAFLLRLGPAGYYDAATPAIIMIVLGLCIRVPVFYLFGLYGKPSGWSLTQLVWRTALSVGLGSAILGVMLLVGAAIRVVPPFPRPALLIDAGLTFLFILLIRLAAYLVDHPQPGFTAVKPLEELRLSWALWFRDGTLFFGILGGSLAIYMLWNKLAFGSFTPISGQVKRWWGTFSTSVYGSPAHTWLAFFGWDTQGDFNAWNPFAGEMRDAFNRLVYHGQAQSQLYNPAWQQKFAIALAIIAMLLFLSMVLSRHRARSVLVKAGILPLFIGSWIQILSYNATGYASPKEWYWLTQQVLLVLLGAWFLHLANDLVFRRWIATRILVWAAVAAFAINAAASYWRDTMALYPYAPAPKNATYAEVVPFLELNTSPGAIIGMTGGGNVGYFLHDRTIVNMDGLINSAAYFADLKAGTSSQYLYETGLQYVFANPQLLNADPYRGQYVGRLERIISFGGKDLMRLLPAPSQ